MNNERWGAAWADLEPRGECLSASPTGMSGGAGGASSSGGTWRTHTGSGFSIEFPGTPRRQNKTQASPLGVLTTQIDQVAVRDGAFQVGVTEMPLTNEQYEALMTAGLEASLDEGINSMVRAVGNAQVTSQGPFSIGAFRGREVQFDASLQGKQAAGYGRVLVVNKKVIEVLWLGERSLKGSADVKRFINSLHVTEAPLPLMGAAAGAGSPGTGGPASVGGGPPGGLSGPRRPQHRRPPWRPRILLVPTQVDLPWGTPAAFPVFPAVRREPAAGIPRSQAGRFQAPPDIPEDTRAERADPERLPWDPMVREALAVLATLALADPRRGRPGINR